MILARNNIEKRIYKQGINGGKLNLERKIRFPLEMEQGVEVRSLEELRENFSLSHVLMYISNGKLVTWLRDRYEYDIADAIEKLNSFDSDLSKKVCEIFDVQYNESDDKDVEELKEKTRRLRLLKEYTSEQKYIDVEEKIAFSQDELYDLLDNGITDIYLCGERFSIPLDKSGISYHGINNPIVAINSKEEIDWEEKNIFIDNVTYDEKYMDLLKSNKCIKESASVSAAVRAAESAVNFDAVFSILERYCKKL